MRSLTLIAFCSSAETQFCETNDGMNPDLAPLVRFKLMIAGTQPVGNTAVPFIDPGSGWCELSPVLRPANKNRASVRCIQWGSRMSVRVAKVRYWAGRVKCNGSSFPHQRGRDTSMAASLVTTHMWQMSTYTQQMGTCYLTYSKYLPNLIGTSMG